ncbi:MAG: NIPSNAP family protein [Cupriavidus necator]
MIIEHRAYTLHLGAEELFWDAQRERGEDGLRPILERLIGSFATRSGPNDQIVSLYRYDSFDDWQSRLFGVYGQARLQPYFRIVRPLIARQESKFLVPAPIDALTPHWGNGRDWLPQQGPLFARATGPGIVEQTCLTFSAGGVPACWEAFRQHALGDDNVALNGLFAAFSSIAGSLNEVLLYRLFPSPAALFEHRARLVQSAAWTSFLRTLAPFTVASEARLLAPSRVTDMSPMFLTG